MKQFIIFSLVCFSVVFTRRDCLQVAKIDKLGRSVRPEKDTHAISDSGHFYIHYDTTGNAAPNLTDSDENGIPDYVDEIGMIADSAHHVLVNVLGYKEEPYDGEGGYDIYIMSYGAGSYGFNYLDNGNTSYLQIDNDYLGFDTKFNLSPLKIMQITVAHEYFHGIQWGYEENLSNNAYFYEMTSMWFEDVIIPDGNDYLDGWIDPLINNPTADFDKTGGGYELALFGHYLSSFLDPKGIETAKNSTIIREIWERYDTTNSNAFNSLKYVLENSYNNNFIDVWVDFMSRNLYNGLYENIDNDYYYYPDQALIDPIRTYKASIDDSLSVQLDIDNKSVDILSYEISDYSAILDIKHNNNDFIGHIVFISEEIEKNDYNGAEDILTHQLHLNDVVHFIYGTESSSQELTIDIVKFISPISPSNLMATVAQDSIILNWHPSLGPGDSLTYILYRDSDSIYALRDTHYIDKQGIEELTSYAYFVTCFNDIGESQPSNTNIIQSWPSEENVTQNQILAIYPNPIRKSQGSHILYALDLNYSNTTLELINIRGQIVKTLLLTSYQQGWHLESINKLITPRVSSGIYVIRIRHDNEFGRTQKVTILP